MFSNTKWNKELGLAIGRSFFQDHHGFTPIVHSSHSCSSPEKALDQCGSEVTPEEVCWLGGPVTLGHTFKGLQISTG